MTGGTGASFAPGQLVLVDSGALAEILKVKAVAASSITTTDDGCVNAHGSGAAVALATVSGDGVMPLSPYLAGG